MGRDTSKHIIIGIIISGLFFCVRGISDAVDTPGPEAPVWCTVSVMRHERSAHDITGQEILASLRVELVTRTPDLIKGLSGRLALPADEGMLFAVDPRETLSFWMKGMKFPLDIIFFDGEKRICEMFQDLQPCEDCTTFYPREPSPYILEINAGLARDHGLRRGDTLVIETCE